MRTTFRIKLLAILGIATIAFGALIVVGATLERRSSVQLTQIAEHYVPRIELGPRLNVRFERLVRALRDAVAARDREALEGTRVLRDELMTELDRAQHVVQADQWVALRGACRVYYTTASTAAERVIHGEQGERSLALLANMQDAQRVVERALRKATMFDQRALTRAFAEAAAAQSTAARIRLIVSVSCLALVLMFCLWLSQSVLRAVREIGEGVARFGRGSFETPIQVLSNDEFGALAQQANQMAASLKALIEQQERSAWLSAGANGLQHQLRGELEPEAVAQLASSYLADYLSAPAAALYWVEADGDLHLLAHYGASGAGPVAPPQRFASGSGLLGRGTATQEITVLEQLPEGYFTLRSALGAGQPRTLALVPLVRAGKTAGVLELALSGGWSEAQHALLMSVRETIAIAIEVARARAALRKLLDESQQQASRLREQEDELRANYDELQAKQEELLAVNTRLQRQAAELQEHRQSLESNNAELQRTRRSLERKAQQLTTVSAYKSQFLANMSHELRTPLNSMIVLSSLLSEQRAGALTEKQTEYCQTILGAAKDLLSLINQVLDLAKVESGKQGVQVAEVPLDELAAYARRIFEPLARDKGLDFVVELVREGIPDKLLTDQRKVEQILNNLLGNAIKFTSAGKVSLTIGPVAPGAALAVRSNEPALVLTVTDSGEGIADEHRERIFRPFEQIEGTSDRRHGGTGLGLSIARELAALLQGELRLESSTPGEGSVFSCYLPWAWRAGEEHARKGSQAVDVSIAPRPNGASSPRPSDEAIASMALSLPTMNSVSLRVGPAVEAIRVAARVLVVEDDRAVADILMYRLREDQIDVVVARNAGQAQDYLGREGFSCVVLDLGLPDIDGLDLLAALHAKYDGNLPPVLVYTGRTLSEAQLSWLEEQAEVVVLKEGLAIERLVDEVRLLTRRQEDGVWQRPGSSIVVPAVRTPLTGRKLLIVDDDMRNVFALSALLRPKGPELFIADNGRAALETLHEHPDIELLLMDMMMPEMDGYEATRALRRDVRFVALPVIAITARAMKNDRERCMMAGATEYLSKPIDAELLLAMISALLPHVTGTMDRPRALHGEASPR